MIFYDYLLTPQLFSYTAISRRNTVSCIKYQYRAALVALHNNCCILSYWLVCTLKLSEISSF